MRNRYLLMMVFVLAVSACGIQKPVIGERITADLFGEGVTVSVDDTLYRADWREIFRDANLQNLIADALEKNADLKIAELNLADATAQLKAAKLSYLPSFAVSPSGTLSIPQGGQSVKTYSLPLSMSWEFNLAGRQAAEREAAEFTWMSSGEQLRSAQLQLIAMVANTYYTLVMLDEQIRLTEESVRLQEETLKAINAMKSVGKMNELAVLQAESKIQETLVSLKELLLQRDKTERAVKLLIGETPGTVCRSTYSDTGTVRMDIDSAVSLVQLASRPDVKSAEYELRAMFSNSKVARSAFFPSVSISGDGSWTNNPGEVINPGKLLLNLIGGLTQPLFRNGSIRAGLESAKARQEQAQVRFEQALLAAGSEVADAFGECRMSREKIGLRQAQVESSRSAYEISTELLRHSASVTYLEVLSAQESYLNARIQLTSDWLQSQQHLINLYKALCP